MPPPPPPPPPHQPSSPSLGALPFGYDITSSADAQFFPPLPPDSLANSLLDNYETRGLDSFIETVGSPGYNDASFFDRAIASAEEGDLSMFGEPNLPPQFYGASSTLPPPHSQHDLPGSQTHAAVRDNPYLHQPMPPLEYPPSMSGEDLNAVSALMMGSRAPVLGHREDPFRPGYISSNQSNSTYPLSSSNAAQLFARFNAGYTPPNRVGRQYQQSASGLPSASPYQPAMPQPALLSHPSTNSIRHGVPPNLHWGSDHSFYYGGYVAPLHQETEEEVTQGLMQKMECLVPQTSADNTRPSSPKRVEESERQKRKRVAVPKPTKEEERDEQEPFVQPLIQQSIEQEPKKRRKASKKARENEGGDKPSTDRRSAKRRRGRPEGRIPSAPQERASPTPSKQRKPQPELDTRPNRHNLSEDQKKHNHILSEQKRRNLIKQGFQDLREIVPSLRSGAGNSRSVILTHAADWLAEFLEGTAELKRIVASLKGEDEETEDDDDNDEDSPEAFGDVSAQLHEALGAEDDQEEEYDSSEDDPAKDESEESDED